MTIFTPQFTANWQIRAVSNGVLISSGYRIEGQYPVFNAQYRTYCVSSNHGLYNTYSEWIGKELVLFTDEYWGVYFTQDCYTFTEPCPTAGGECEKPTPTPTPVPSPTVSMTPFEVVEKFGTKDVNITIANNASGTTKFTLTTTAGTGTATFENGTNETIVNGNVTNQPLKIKGVLESSQVDNIRIEARVNGGSTVLASDNFTVAVITSLIFERFDSTYVDLDANPGPDGTPTPGEGRRIFPDKKDVTDAAGTVDRSLVKVKAQVAPAAANLTVYFGSFDLDDPSAMGVPIDPLGADGKDNNGAVTTSKSGDFTVPTGITCDNSATG
ncbi:MAG TPA: hypothetical protein VK612_11860, partial [Pyrinomonadaceae bacterium]|nr:hypothetical protein [Pyrinomonadaceae bacterium]